MLLKQEAPPAAVAISSAAELLVFAPCILRNKSSFRTRKASPLPPLTAFLQRKSLPRDSCRWALNGPLATSLSLSPCHQIYVLNEDEQLCEWSISSYWGLSTKQGWNLTGRVLEVHDICLIRSRCAFSSRSLFFCRRAHTWDFIFWKSFLDSCFAKSTISEAAPCKSLSRIASTLLCA